MGDFYYDEDSLPCIYIAGYSSRTKGKNDLIQILSNIAYFLTFYYQWYFYEFDKRSDRSLKIEATKWKNYILNEYFTTNVN